MDMREAHAHIAALGESLTLPNLSACQNVDECLAIVRRVSKQITDARAWVRLHSARVEGWAEQRWPTITELDEACRESGSRPCVIRSFDHHAALANTAAMTAAGLKAGEVVAPKGVVCADPITGHATGMLLEDAASRAWNSAPTPTSTEQQAMVLAGLRALSGLGFEEVHDLHSPTWLGPALAHLERSGELHVREVRLYPPISALAHVYAERAAWESTRVRLAGGKVFADGTLNSRTALMLHPYREPLDGQPCGRAMVTDGELDRAIALTESLGLHLAVHAIGDASVRMVLDSIERTATLRDPGNRHRIEHCELIDEADAHRFARLGVVCSVQPCHLLADVEVLTRQLPHRLHRVLPLRDLIESGCSPGADDGLLWFGSDVPIVRADPGDSIQAAVKRRRQSSPATEAIGLEQHLSEREAWMAFGVLKQS